LLLADHFLVLRVDPLFLGGLLFRGEPV
jgi:hypothetical protein